jgi:N-formylglutamate amidohydrolase
MKHTGENDVQAIGPRFLGKLLLFVFVVLLHAPVCASEEHNASERLLTIWSGMLPIIIAAPHGGRMPIPGVSIRRGIGVPQFTSRRDGNTAELVEAVGLKISERLVAKPFLVIARFERKYVDANRPEAGAYESPSAKPYYDDYHQALQSAASEVRVRWGGGILLDIHGQSAERDAIFCGTDNGRSVVAMRDKHGRGAFTGPRSILGQLALKGYRILPDVGRNEPERRYTGGYTTRTYGSHRGTRIDAIQLELGTNLRTRGNLERTADDLAEAIATFARAFLSVNGSAASPSFKNGNEIATP